MLFIKKVFVSLVSSLLIIMSMGATANADSNKKHVNPITTTETQEIDKQLKDDRNTLRDVLVKYLGKDYIDHISYTTEYNETNENSKLVVHYKNENTKITQVKKELQKRLATKIKFNKVDYTHEDLSKFTSQMNKKIEDNGEIDKLAGFDPDAHKEKIYIQYVNSFNESTKKELKNIFEKVEFVKTESKPQSTIARDKDYNKLGGGLAIDIGGGFCTTTGVASKGGSWFVLTAGHCLEGDNSTISQYNEPLGTDHSTLVGRGVDAGVVKVRQNMSNIKRYAYDGLYLHAENDRDYDAKFKSEDPAGLGDEVTMSGVTSGVQTGVVTDMYTEVNYEELPVLQKVRVATYSSDNGDSGAPVFTTAYGGNKISGIHSGSNSYKGEAYFTPIEDVEEEYSTSEATFDFYQGDEAILID
ncbi:hypothetical protein N781_05060 [Pontibacillus halophilus JSM 076056 = DSM 19796]|uniref:Peptidase S1 domain-containing protein n=2 Tax=Pontibacillus TaxID=289201 RepID=A0A0A5I5Q6_9BACI|nr:S1 family peptidase [Pontibacillus halophilus]KGX91162.1 hypothetical protein N781_05060 [Pontibacillus halophilus JSM 076056 = DSM 19796]